MYKKFLFIVLSIFLFSVNGQAENISKLLLAEKDSVPNVSYLIRGNWDHLMPHGCVLLDEFNHLTINAKITLGTNELNSFPGLYYTHQFHTGVTSSLIGPIDSADLVLDTLPSGHLVYTYTHNNIYNGDFSIECELNPLYHIPFYYNITLRDEFGNPYPIEDYTTALAPPYIYDPDGDGNPILPTVSYEGIHDLCCYEEESPAGSELTSNSSNNSVSTEKFTVDSNADENNIDPLPIEFLNTDTPPILSVFPNPFTGFLNVNFETTIASSTIIEFRDINDKLIFQQKIPPGQSVHDTILIDTNHLGQGVYFCSLKNDTQSKVVKVLKINR